MGKKLKTTLLSFFIIFLSMDSSFSLTVDRVIATVNNEIITQSDYNRFISKTDTFKGEGEIDENILKRIIEEKILLQEAKKWGIDASVEEIEQSIRDIQKANNLTSEEFEKSLASESMSFNDYKNFLKEDIISLKLIDREVYSKIIVTDEDISNYYEKNIDLFKEHEEKNKVKAVFLKVSDGISVTESTDLKIKALKIYSAIKKGEPFDKMVNLYSDEPLKSRNGLLGEFQKGGLIPSLERKISEMKEGEVSEPVWSKEGVYILKLIKRTRGTFTPLDKVRDRIYSILYKQKKEEKFNQWMKSLWGKSLIKIKHP
jgi:peptidyl-prolyl cis-trans isomerase SurA